MKPKVSVIVPVYNVQNYIQEMLKSVADQSFREFEVLVINDGSTDGSQEIIDKFSDADARFISVIKENGGVASARNMGIKKAKGDFVVFYDPDDYIPREALKKMYTTAVTKKADMVIGVMKEISLGEPLIYMHSQKLAKQDKINPLDQHFFGAWSLCHKMFSLNFIRENNLAVEELKNAEDGVFTFSALNCTDEIYGCDSVAYNYYKRPFWLAPSATQTISKDYLEGLLTSHDRILEEAEKLASSKLNDIERERYLEKLYIRFIEGEMINGYYRGIWRTSDDIIPKIKERTERYRKHISEKEWLNLVKRHRDLDLDHGYMSLSEMAEKPLISVILSAIVAPEKINLMIESLYNQNFPRFEMLIPEDRKESLNHKYKDRQNISFVANEGKEFKEEALKNATGKYVIIADEYVIFNKNTLINMESKLHFNEKLDFVATIIKNFDGKSFNQMKTQNAMFGFTPISAKRKDMFTDMDTFMSNKLIRKTSLENFQFNNNGVMDVANLYGGKTFLKVRRGTMITDITDKEVMRKALKKAPELLTFINGEKNIAIESAIRKLKRCITREDIDKLKRIIGNK